MRGFHRSRLFLILLVELRSSAEKWICLSLQLNPDIISSLDGARKGIWLLANLSLESFSLKISLDIFKSWLKWRKNLWNFIHIYSSKQLAFRLEDQKIGLLLNVKDVVVQQEISFGIFGHFVDETDSFIEVIVFINSLEEEWKNILISLLDINKSRW